MKKMIALLLVVVICFALVACDNSKATTDQKDDSTESTVNRTNDGNEKATEYIGKWARIDAPEQYILEINENGAAISYAGTEKTDLRWGYNSFMDGIIVAANGDETYFMQINQIDGLPYLLMAGRALYRQENLDLAEDAEYNRLMKIIDTRLENFSQTEIGATHTLQNGATIKILGFSKKSGKLSVHISLTNTTQETIQLSPLEFSYSYIYNKIKSSSWTSRISFPSNSLDAGETKEDTLEISFSNAETEIRYAIIGFTFNEEKYCYIITDYID